uniref:Uncharacterized protein n=1 Tax=Anguilla anguilla TaxID=7936 RepID=A0A0E9PVE1_ANGAN
MWAQVFVLARHYDT